VLSGCSGELNTQVVGPRALAGNGNTAAAALRSGTRKPGGVESERNAEYKCSSGGGSWRIPPQGRKISGILPYGQNNCATRKKVVGVHSEVNQAGGPCKPEEGYTSSGLEVFLGAPAITFGGSGLIATLSSRNLNESIQYTVFFYDSTAGTTLSQQPVGYPMNGEVQFSSPFEKGFELPAYHALVILICYQ
jgi:hypothetical protein